MNWSQHSFGPFVPPPVYAYVLYMFMFTQGKDARDILCQLHKLQRRENTTCAGLVLKETSMVVQRPVHPQKVFPP